MPTIRVKARPGAQRVNDAAVRAIATGPGVRRDLDRRATRVAAAVRIGVPMRTGKLRSSVRTESFTTAGGAGVRVLIGRGVPYSAAYLFGARPHVIEPRRKKMLRFVVGGQVVFSRRVQHPGNKPHNVLQESTRFWRD